MTHFYDFYKRVPRQRRKRLAKFLHELKCLCGRKYHVHVLEMLENCEEDYLMIDTTNLPINDEIKLTTEIIGLMDKYFIPRGNLEQNDEPYYTDERGITIYPYTDF